MRNNRIFLLLATCYLLTSCDNSTQIERENIAGFCLTFDDIYVNEWYSLSGLLDSNNVKATFFVTLANNLDSLELDKLRKLQDAGHEIASHGWKHINALDYLRTHTVKEYLENEVLPSLNYLNENNLKITSYSYPYGYNCDSLDNEMLHHFSVLRDVTEEQRHTTGRRIEEIDEIYFKFDETKVIAGLGIDKNFNITFDILEEGFKRASENNEVIVFYCHKPVNKATASYQIEYNYLKELFLIAKKYNLKRYLFSELTK